MLEVLFICIESITSIVCFVMQFFSEIFWYYFKSTIRHSELGTRTQGINSRQALNQNKGKNKGTWKLLSDNILLLLTYFDIVKTMNLYLILYRYSLVSNLRRCNRSKKNHRKLIVIRQIIGSGKIDSFMSIKLILTSISFFVHSQ